MWCTGFIYLVFFHISKLYISSQIIRAWDSNLDQLCMSDSQILTVSHADYLFYIEYLFYKHVLQK